MNRTYRLVWNDQTQRYVPAPETARGRGKGKHGKTALAGGIAALALTLGMAATPPAYAQLATSGAGGWGALGGGNGGAGGSSAVILSPQPGQPGSGIGTPGAGGSPGTRASPDGQNGGDGSFSGGGGGGGAGYGNDSSRNVLLPLTGGKGGNGGYGDSTQFSGGGGGGGGGTGGDGARFHDSSPFTPIGVAITGGQGGDGGLGLCGAGGCGGSGGGGGGGAGVVVASPDTSFSLELDGDGAVIIGGAGGNGMGASGNVRGTGGGGGAGVYFASTGALELRNGATVTGGAGGDGINGYGGSGGAGALLQGRGSVVIRATGKITGGAGFGTGSGGAAVQMTASGISVLNAGILQGGAGGGLEGRNGDFVSGGNGSGGAAGFIPGQQLEGRGGEGIRSASGGISITNLNGGVIRGGTGYGGQANAITLFGDDNWLEIHNGSVIDGKVVVSGGGANNTLALGGNAGDGSVALFNVTDIGDATKKYSGFDSFAKTGSGTWTLTGTGSSDQNWQVFGGGSLQADTNSLKGNARLSNKNTLIFEQSFNGNYNGVIDGPGLLNKSGTGMVTLTNSNTYTGGTTISGGTLQIGDGGTSGSITGNVVNSGTLAFNRSDTLTFNGNISGTGVVRQIGTGTTILTGTNVYTGGTTISGGTLQIGNGGTSGSLAGNVANAGTLAFNRGDALTFAGSITGAGAVRQIGTGTTVLTGANTYTGDTTISGGTLQIGDGGTTGSIEGNVANDGTLAFNRSDALTFAGSISGTGAVRQIGTGTTTLTGSNTYTGGTTVSGGTLTIYGEIHHANADLIVGNAVGDNASLVLNAGYVNNRDGSIGRAAGSTGSVTLTTISFWDNKGDLRVGDGGNGTLTFEKFSELHVTNQGTSYIGYGTDSVGSVTVADHSSWFNAGALYVGYMGKGTLNIGAYDLSAATTGGLVTATRIATGTGGSGTVNFNQTDGVIVNAPVEGNIAVNQRGSGVTVLIGANTYTGGTTIGGGTLQIGNNGTSGSLTGNVDIAGAGTLAFYRTDTLTFNGNISGTGVVRQIGTGTTILTGTNVYTGGTTISGGTLQIGNGGTSGSLAGNVANAGTLAFNRGDALTFAGSITGAGAVRQIGTGTTVLTGANTYTGDTTISGGTLQIGDGGTTGSIAGNVLNDGTLAFNRSDALRFDGTISGNGTLTKTGAGTVTLTQANTYTGGTKVKGGTLEIDGGGIDHGNANLIVGESGGENAALVIRNGAVNDLIGRIADSGGSTGAVTVTGANSTWANAGNLYVGRSGNGTLRIENGGKVNSASGFISSADGSNGSVTVTGSGSTWTNAGTLYVGSSGNGALTIDNGGTVSSAQGDIGANRFSSAVVTVASGGTWTIGGRLGFGLNSGTGTLNIGAYDLTAPTTAGTVIANYLTTGGGSGTVNFNQTDDIIFSAPMQDNIAVNQRGSGTTTLTGNNIYNRGTTISGGTLQIGDGGTSGSIVGNVANNGTLAFNRSGTLTFAGSISGNGTVRQIGSGTTILTGANTHTGGTTISGGTLQIGNGGTSGSLAGNVVNDGTLAFNRTDALTFAGSISGTGALRQAGNGTTTLTGVNTYSGDTTVSAGTLQFGDGLSAGGANILGGRINVTGGTLAIRTPATVSVAQDVAFADNTALAITATASGPSLHADRLSLGTGVAFNLSGIDDVSQLDKVLIDTRSGIAGDFGPVTIGGAAGIADYLSLATRKSADGKQYLATYDLTWNAGNQAHGTFTLAGANDRFTVGAALADQAASATGWDGASLTKAGAGTLILTGANTYTGGTTITGGTLQIGDGGTTGSIVGNVANGGTLAFNRSDALTFAGMISGNGTLTKNGAGTLTLTGANTYAGGTTVKGGTLEIDGGGIDHRNATLTVGESGGENAALVIRNGTVINSTGSIGQDAGSVGTVTVTGSGSTWTNAGELLVGNAGKGALTIENGGTVSSTWGFLGVDASSSAVVTVASGGTWKLVTGGSPSKLVFGAGASAGTLNIGAYDLSRPTTAGTVTADILDTGTGSGTVNFNQTDATTFSSRITGNIAVNQRGSGTTTLTGDNTYTGGTAITGGTLQIGNGGTTGSLIGDVVNNGSLAFNRSDALTFTGSISGNGAVHQVGAGTTILTGTNTYTGGTTISGGTLQIGNGGPWGLLAGNVVNNGTLAFNRDGLLVLNGAISGTGAVRQIGGTTILTGTNTYAGDTTVSAGTLQFGDTISAGGANTLGGRIDVTGGGLAIHTLATVTVAQDVAFADNTALAITATPSGPSLRADRLGLGTGVAFTLSGIDNLGQTDKAFIDTASGITGEFGTVTVGGASGTVDYLSLVTRKSGDGKQYLATYNLIWNAGNQAHGTFTLADAGERFTLGAALANQDASGAWDGKSLTKAGSGTLILTGANTYTGGTTITDGTLQIGNGGTSGSIEGDVTNNGTLAFNRSDALTFEGTISGNGAIRQTGSGRVNLTGDSSGFSGSTTVEQGTLSVNGQLGGALSVGAAGRLQGNGTVGDTVVAGTVAPGNSIGTLNVASVTFNPGSTYEVEVNAAGQSDKIVAAGAATINGGTVRVLAGAGNYAPATTYTILTANGGRTGTFDGVISNFAFLTPTLSYDANDVTLTLTRNTTAFAAIGATRNQAAVGGGVGSLGAGNVLANAVVGLSADQARAAFDLLSGEIHASAKSALIENGRHVQNAMTDRLRGAFDILGAQTAEPIKVAALGDVPVLPAAVHSGPVLWTQGYGSWGRLDGDGNAAGLKHDSQGIFIGTDSPVGDWRFGAVAGIGRTGFDTSDRRSNGHSDNYHFGLYGGARWDALSFRTGAAWTRHDLSTSRTVAIPGFTDSLKADYRARTVQVFGELGYRMQGRQAALEPFANLAHTNLRTDGFTERGGAAALRTSATTTDATFSTLGLRTATRVALGMTEARLAGTLGWRHAFGSATPESTLRFASGGNDFGIAGTPIARNSAVFEAGLDFRLASNATLGASYVGQLASGAREHGVKVGFNMEF